MRVMVIGIRGEVGRSLGRALAGIGHDVIGVSSLTTSTASVNSVTLDTARVFIRNQDVEAVLNCSGPGDLRQVRRSGLEATQELGPSLADMAIPAVLISTTRVLEGYSGEIAEDAPPKSLTEYGTANAEHEALWTQLAGPSARILRVCNFFTTPSSPDSPQVHLLPWSLVTDGQSTGHIAVRSARTTCKDFVSAEDVAKAVELLLSSRGRGRVCATTPAATLSLEDLVRASQGAFSSVGLGVPSSSFGDLSPTSPRIHSGWLAEEGWAAALSTDAVRDEITTWLRSLVQP